MVQAPNDKSRFRIKRLEAELRFRKGIHLLSSAHLPTVTRKQKWERCKKPYPHRFRALKSDYCCLVCTPIRMARKGERHVCRAPRFRPTPFVWKHYRLQHLLKPEFVEFD